MALLGHKKSRRGCTHCKRRRVKCDESRPCRNCIRRGETCSLLLSPSQASAAINNAQQCPSCRRNTIASSSSTPPASDTQTSPTITDHSGGNDPFVELSHVVGKPQALGPEDWNVDLYLMHHYSTSTSLTIVRRPEIQKLWQGWMIEEAMKYDFLMHGLLAAAALHLAYLQPADAAKYSPLAAKHQSNALALFRPVLFNINEENCSALFAFAMVTSTFAMAVSSFRSPELRGFFHNEAQMSVPEIVEQLVLTRGVAEVLSPARGWIRKGPFGILIGGTYCVPELDTYRLPSELEARFSAMLHLAKDTATATEVNYCVEALKDLEHVYKHVIYCYSNRNEDVEMGLAWKWAVMVPMAYIDLVRQGHPAALIILAHFCILCGTMRHSWFLKGWDEQALRAVTTSLPPVWADWMAWPQKQLTNGLPALKTELGPPLEGEVVRRKLFHRDPIPGGDGSRSRIC